MYKSVKYVHLLENFKNCAGEKETLVLLQYDIMTCSSILKLHFTHIEAIALRFHDTNEFFIYNR